MQLFLRRFSLDISPTLVFLSPTGRQMVGGVDIEGGGISKEQSEKGQIVIAIIMLWQGSTNIKNKSVLPVCVDEVG